MSYTIKTKSMWLVHKITYYIAHSISFSVFLQFAKNSYKGYNPTLPLYVACCLYVYRCIWRLIHVWIWQYANLLCTIPSSKKQQRSPFWWKEFSSSHLGTVPWWSKWWYRNKTTFAAFNVCQSKQGHHPHPPSLLQWCQCQDIMTTMTVQKSNVDVS